MSGSNISDLQPGFIAAGISRQRNAPEGTMSLWNSSPAWITSRSWIRRMAMRSFRRLEDAEALGLSGVYFYALSASYMRPTNHNRRMEKIQSKKSHVGQLRDPHMVGF
jgi:hypothetical protein